MKFLSFPVGVTGAVAAAELVVDGVLQRSRPALRGNASATSAGGDRNAD